MDSNKVAHFLRHSVHIVLQLVGKPRARNQPCTLGASSSCYHRACVSRALTSLRRSVHRWMCTGPAPASGCRSDPTARLRLLLHGPWPQLPYSSSPHWSYADRHQHLMQNTLSYGTQWRSANMLCQINKVTLRQARLVLGWVSVYGHWSQDRNSLELLKKRRRLDFRLYFFAERVINLWNSLDDQTVKSTSVNSFKSNLSRLRRWSWVFSWTTLFTDPRGCPVLWLASSG